MVRTRSQWQLSIYVTGLLSVLYGCAAPGADPQHAAASAAVAQQTGLSPVWDGPPPVWTPGPEPRVLSLAQATELAFTYNPRVRAARARLDRLRADLEASSRPQNPRLGWQRLDPTRGPGEQVTRNISLGVADLLLLPDRRAFALGELERNNQLVAHELLLLRREVEHAWYASVAAQMMAAAADESAKSAESAAALAERFHKAGNIDQLQLAQARAAAAEARSEAEVVAADQALARGMLATAIGLPVHSSWSTSNTLALPAPTNYDPAEMLALAQSRRSDVAARARGVQLHTEALTLARRWRWLGAIDFGYEHESEPDGGSMRGPTLEFTLPIFDQGQAAIARAEAGLAEAQAEAAAIKIALQNEVQTYTTTTTQRQSVVQRERDVELPARSAVVACTQQRVNFMLAGVFELLAAQRELNAAWRRHIEHARDYWIARTDLRAAVGGALPDDDAPLRELTSPRVHGNLRAPRCPSSGAQE